MARTSQRTKDMKKNFMSHHEKGMNIAEIANLYSISGFTVYRSLQEIADINGVTRESLLKRVHSTHSPFIKGKKEDLNFEEIQNLANTVKEEIKKTIDTINHVI